MPQTTNQPFNKQYALAFVLGFYFLLGGPCLIGYAGYRNQVDSASLKWPRTSGTIIQYDKTYHGGRNSGYIYTATYAYNVNGMHYTGQRYAVWSDSVAYGGGSDYMDVHPASSSVDVYYDPGNPENAVLVPGPNHWLNRILIWSGRALIVVGIVLLIVMRKISREAGIQR